MSDIEGVMCMKGMMGEEGATGQFLSVLILVCGTLNVTYEDIGMAGITGGKGPLRARRAHCHAHHFAHCQGRLHVLAMLFMAMLMPMGLVWVASMRMTTLIRAWMRDMSSGKGGLPLLRSTARIINADVSGASRRLRLPATGLRLPWMRARRRAARCGPGAPATTVIRCTRVQAAAHRDHSPARLLLIVAPIWIAMGTGLQRIVGTPVRAVAVALHSAATGTGIGSAAVGGRLRAKGVARATAEGRL